VGYLAGRHILHFADPYRFMMSTRPQTQDEDDPSFEMTSPQNFCRPLRGLLLPTAPETSIKPTAGLSPEQAWVFEMKPLYAPYEINVR